MPPFDWIAVVYFLYLAAAAVALRRHRVALRAVLTAGLVIVVARAPVEPWPMVHPWMPALYLLAGYWLPAALVREPHASFERWLQSFDRRSTTLRLLNRISAIRPIATLFEAAYLFCYPLIALGFLALWINEGQTAVARYWTGVLLAGFSCYGLLPWLPTRPPRALEEGVSASRTAPATRAGLKPDATLWGVQAINRWLLAHASVQWNTFPSGHVSTAMAIAITVAVERPLDGAAFGVVALGIAAGSVAGRYHYVADMLAGAVAGAAASAAAILINRS